VTNASAGNGLKINFGSLDITEQNVPGTAGQGDQIAGGTQAGAAPTDGADETGDNDNGPGKDPLIPGSGLPNPLGDFFKRLHPQRPAHPFVAAEQVDDDRHRAAFDVLKEQGRPAIGRLAHAVGDLGDFEDRIDLGRNADQLAVILQLGEKIREIVVSHYVGRVGEMAGIPPL
jgi:hypothetical protein